LERLVHLSASRYCAGLDRLAVNGKLHLAQSVIRNGKGG
jgi:hypothetical protein